MTRALFERHDFSDKRRVIVVGDIHGRFDLLEERLDELSFDPELDVAVLLGDLVDRGEGSLEALDWCNRPGIIRIRGNHEQIVEATVRQPGNLEWHLKSGGEWFRKVKAKADRQHWADTLTDCPVAIEAIMPDGRTCGFVHADVPVAHWSLLEAALANADARDDLSIAGHCMWSRERIKIVRAHLAGYEFYSEIDCSVPGIDHVFFGHTILPEPITHGNCTWIDTGAFRSGILTVIVVAQKTSFSGIVSSGDEQLKAA
jgi:serine/threonine protein phosphatase 1